MSSNKCQVCEGEVDRHQFIDDLRVAQLKAEYALNYNQISSNSSVSSDYMSIQLPFPPRSTLYMKYACYICYIEFTKDDLVQIEGSVHQICLLCMNTYIKGYINNMKVYNLNCPHCGLKLSAEVVREYIDNVTFNKYKMFLRNVEIQKNPHLKWCPNPKCSIVIIINYNKRTTKCPKCATEICNKCNREAHPRRSCNSVFQNYIKNWYNSSDIQNCKKCKGVVYKISGCNHMTCPVCNHYWCWLCGGTYSSMHFNPFNPLGCPGLQDRQKSYWGKCRILAWRIVLFLFFIVAIPCVLPFAMMFSGPALTLEYVNNKFYPYRCCQKLVAIIFSVILGLVINPFVWVGLIIYFLPKGIDFCVSYFRRRRAANETSNELIKEKFIREAEHVYDENEILQ